MIDISIFKNEIGEWVERVCLNIKGNDVQILRYNGNNQAVVVKVNQAMAIKPLNQIDTFIKARI